MRAITIDGPAAAGKGTTAKRIADELGYTYCDTGALYRALAVGFLDKGLNKDSSVAEFESALPKLSVSLKTSRDGDLQVYTNDEDVTGRIRTEEVSSLASISSAIPAVRAHLKHIQRSIAKEQDVVMEGRDIGTVILPQADLKIFLTASLAERASRRQKQLAEKGINTIYHSVLKDMEERDTRDSSRATAPLQPAADAILVDNTEKTIEETVRLIIGLANERFGLETSPVQAEAISQFNGEYFFLSNFYENYILYEGMRFRNNEAAFQAAKTLNQKQRREFSTVTGRDAKRMGHKVTLRSDWERVKNDIMLQILRIKFAPGTLLAKRLVATGNRPLIEGNAWHDNYWGVCQCDDCKGEVKNNHLGKLLEKVRTELALPNKQGTEKKGIKYVVVFNYSFDHDCRAYPFEDETSAKEFLFENFNNEVRIDVEENGYDTEFSIQEDGWYAQIVNHFIDRDDITEMRIAEICL